MKTVVGNVRVVTRDNLIENGYCVVSEGKIQEVGRGSVRADREIDGGGGLLVPGFVDLHCHGGAGFDFIDATEEEVGKIAAFHLAHGTTTLIATTLTAELEKIHGAMSRIRNHMRQKPETTIAGIFLEGPWLNPAQCGAQNVGYMKLPDPDLLEAWKKEFPELLRMGAAPELEGGLAFGKKAEQLGILASVAHTDAEYSVIEQAAQNGYRLMTHLWSGMKGVTRKNAYRYGGAVEAGLVLDAFAVELIADGRHLPDELLKLAYRCKGPEGICLVTDAIRAAGLPEGATSMLGSIASGTEIIVEDGVAKLPDRQSFAGSVATADRLYRKMAEAVGRDPVALSRMSSLTPATLMGFSDRGEIAEGKRADLLILDQEYRIRKIMKNGEIQA